MDGVGSGGRSFANTSGGGGGIISEMLDSNDGRTPGGGAPRMNAACCGVPSGELGASGFAIVSRLTT
jgi:hypothetical protein